MSNLPKTNYWIKDKDFEKTKTANYWNDEESEKKKDWYIETEKDLSAKNYIEGKGFTEIFLYALNLAKKQNKHIKGRVLDIAAGVGYTSAIISKEKQISNVFCMDISKHRIEKLAPIIFKQYSAEESKIQRIIGSFYDLKLPDNSIDIVIMAQAFHHALNPERMLKEVYRVLKNQGFVIVTGEQVITQYQYLSRFFKKLVKDILSFLKLSALKTEERFKYGIRDLFPSDKIKGDTHYTLKLVRDLVEDHGFNAQFNKVYLGKKSEWIYFFTKK